MRTLREFPGKEHWARPVPEWDSSRKLRFQNVTVSYTTEEPHEISRVVLPNRAGERKIPIIEMFGLAAFDKRVEEDGIERDYGSFSVYVRVHGFLPYFYARITEKNLLEDLDKHREESMLAKTAAKHVFTALEGHTMVLRVVPVHRQDIYGWSPGKTWFWQITVALPLSVAALRRLIHRVPKEDGKLPEDGLLNEPRFGSCTFTYESNVEFPIRFMDDHGACGMGWAELEGGTYKIVDPALQQSYTHLEVDVHYRDVKPLPFTHQENVALRVMSFDIESMGRGKAFPVPERDPIGCICVKLWEMRPDGKWKKMKGAAFTWKRPSAPDPATMEQDLIVVANSEHEMKMYFAKFIRLSDPDIFTGHNINNFDWWYIIRRADALALDNFAGCWDSFYNLGRKKGRAGRSRLTNKKMESGAMGKVEYKLVTMPGRNPEFDNMILRQRSVAEKHSSYGLDYLANKELGVGKIDMPYDRITPMLNGTPEEVWEVVRYCILDAELPFRIMMKKNDVPNYIEMARLCAVAFRMLLVNGQQIRFQSLLLQTLHPAEHFLLPFMQPPEKKKKRGGPKDYEGATVLDPDIDYYVCADLPSAKSEVKRLLRGEAELGEDIPGGDKRKAEEKKESKKEKKKRKKKEKKERKRKAEKEPEEAPEPKRYSGTPKPPVVHGRSHEIDMAFAIRCMEEKLADKASKRPNRPVATLDFASLYPSIMQAHNLSYETWVPKHRLEEARAHGLPLERMANGEWFIDPWDVVVPKDGESIKQACDRLRAAGGVVELKQVKHYVKEKRVEREKRRGRVVKQVREETEWVNFRAQEKYVTRYVWYEEVWKVRNEDRYGVLPKQLDKLLSARKRAKFAMGTAQKKLKVLKDAYGLSLLFHGDNTHKTNVRALENLIDRGTKDMVAQWKDLAGLRTRLDMLADLMTRFMGKKETKASWKRLAARLRELGKAAWRTLVETFGAEEELAVVKDEGMAAALKLREWFERKIEDWEAEEAANDARQMALKVVCNSVYGATGATVGKLPCLAISSAVTAMGRKMIMQCKTIAEEHDPNTHLYAHGNSPYRTKVVYGDSVTGETPCVVRNRATGMVEVRRIDELANGQAEWTEWHETKEKVDTENWDVWTEQGWTRIHRVIRHHVPASKRIIEVTTHTGSVRVTDEHSLLRPNATPETERIDAKDVVVGQQIVHADLPRPDVEDAQVSEEEARLMGFFFADGTCGDYACQSGRKRTWRITKSNEELMDETLKRARTLYPNINFKKYDIRRSSKTFSVTATNPKEIQPRYRELFYDPSGCKRVPPCILNAPANVRRAFFEGYYAGDGDKETDEYTRFDVRGQIGALGMYQLLQSLGERVSINVRQDKIDIYRLTLTRSGKPQRPPHGSINAIKKIREIPHDGCTVYDLQTENHHFHAGVGRIIVHNTDSVFIAIEDCATMKEAFKIAGSIAKECTRSFYSGNIKLELEKIFKRLLLMSKKRYWGIKVEFNKNGDLVESEYNRGTEKVRRDNAPIVRGTITRAMDVVSQEDDVEKAIKIVQEVVGRMQRGDVPIEDYIITKALSKDPEDYAVMQAHIALIERIQQRKPGTRFDKGERIPFVFVGGLKKSKTVDMVEDPQYAQERGLPINWRYYLENQLMKPVCRFFGPLLSPPSASKKERMQRAIDVIFASSELRSFRVDQVARDDLMARWLQKPPKPEEDSETEESDEEEEEDLPPPVQEKPAMRPPVQSTLASFFTKK